MRLMSALILFIILTEVFCEEGGPSEYQNLIDNDQTRFEHPSEMLRKDHGKVVLERIGHGLRINLSQRRAIYSVFGLRCHTLPGFRYQGEWMSSDPLNSILRRITRKPRPQQFFGLMGRRSSRQKLNSFVGLMGKRTPVEPDLYEWSIEDTYNQHR